MIKINPFMSEIRDTIPNNGDLYPNSPHGTGFEKKHFKSIQLATFVHVVFPVLERSVIETEIFHVVQFYGLQLLVVQ